MGSNISLVVTSCDRHDLLKETLDSFIRVNCGGAKPDACIIVEDGPTPMPDWLASNIHFYSANVGKVRWINNECRRGQIYSIDRAYALVTTDFIFHCEDDWTFAQGGDWLCESKRILDKYPKILQVSLRGQSGWHTLIDLPPFEGFKIAQPYWKHGWGGISFNPGLRRVKDWKDLGSYGRHVQYGSQGLGHEIALSKLLLDRGFRIADLNRRIVEHTGGARSRMKDHAIPIPKVLIAIPVCHNFSYGAWESSQSPSFDKSRAYNGEAYGTDIHISGANPRIAALRETWLRDVSPFASHVDYKLFYGGAGGREAGADEVFLNVEDDYAHLPHKSIAICKWAAERDYDFVFKADDDSYVWVSRLVHELMSVSFDYAGYVNGRMCSGGPGYWLSKRALTVVAEKASASNHWAEDVTVGKTLFHHNIQPVMLPTHYPGFSQHWFDISNVPDDAVCIHALKPETMRELYRRENAA